MNEESQVDASSLMESQTDHSGNPPLDPEAGPQPVSDYWLKKVLIGGSTVLTISSTISAAGAVILLVGGSFNAARGATCSSRLQWQQRQEQIEAEIEGQARIQGTLPNDLQTLTLEDRAKESPSK
jgi:hypothetical protein